MNSALSLSKGTDNNSFDDYLHLPKGLQPLEGCPLPASPKSSIDFGSGL